MMNIEKGLNLVGIIFHLCVFLTILIIEKQDPSYTIFIYTILGLVSIGLYIFLKEKRIYEKSIKGYLLFLKDTISSSFLYIGFFVFQNFSTSSNIVILFLFIIILLFGSVFYFIAKYIDKRESLTKRIKSFKKRMNSIDQKTNKKVYDYKNNIYIELVNEYEKTKHNVYGIGIKLGLFLFFAATVLISLLSENYLSLLFYELKTIVVPIIFIISSIICFIKVFIPINREGDEL